VHFFSVTNSSKKERFAKKMNVKVADIRPTHYNKCLPIWKELQQARGGIVNLENTGERFNIALVNLMVCETTRARLTACDSFVESYDKCHRYFRELLGSIIFLNITSTYHVWLGPSWVRLDRTTAKTTAESNSRPCTLA